MRRSLGVVVEAAAAFFPVPALVVQLLNLVIANGLFAGTLVVVIHHVVGKVDTGQIVETEGTHGVVQAVLTGNVQVLVGAVALLHQPAGFGVDGTQNTVDDKAVDFLVDDDGLFAGGKREIVQGLDGLAAGVLAADQKAVTSKAGLSASGPFSP